MNPTNSGIVSIGDFQAVASWVLGDSLQLQFDRSALTPVQLNHLSRLKSEASSLPIKIPRQEATRASIVGFDQQKLTLWLSVT
jgi:hypothetical protein